MESLEKKLHEIVGKENVLKNEPMSKHTSIRIGGPAEYFIKVNTIKELKELLEYSNKNEIPFTLIGNGTNLLVRDGGIKGLVLKVNFNNFKINKSSDDILLTVEAGMSLAGLANIVCKEEITGLEFLSGIPGTIGGAIRMNAGAYGSEIKDFVVKSRYMTYDGKIKTLTLPEHQFEYRNSVFSKLDCVIIDTTLKLKKGSRDEIQNKMNELSAARKNSQPLEYPNFGSTFKRKDGVIVSKLIDECGLKGYSIGDAEVSTKHAGFVVNKGNATSKDVLKVIDHVKKVMKEKKSIDLDLEILVLGDEK